MEYPKEGLSEYNTVTTTGITISSTVSTQLFAANARRVYARITNKGVPGIYIGLGVAASTSSGFRLNRNETWETTRNGLFRGAINAISNTASDPVVLALEGYTDED